MPFIPFIVNYIIMNKTSLILIIAIIALLILGIFLGRDDAQTIDETTADITLENSDEFVRKFNVQHAYNDGEHTFAGIINTPTPCYKIKVDSEETEQGIALMVTTESSDDSCAQVETAQPFLYKVVGPETVSGNAMINDEKVELNLFEKDEVVEIDLGQFEAKG